MPTYPQECYARKGGDSSIPSQGLRILPPTLFIYFFKPWIPLMVQEIYGFIIMLGFVCI